MSEFPKVGMKFEQSRKRLMKYKSALQNPNMRKSLINQVRLHEGEKAAAVLEDEFVKKRMIGDRNLNKGLRCSGATQFGSWGNGNSASKDNSFEKVGEGKFRKVY